MRPLYRELGNTAALPTNSPKPARIKHAATNKVSASNDLNGRSVSATPTPTAAAPTASRSTRGNPPRIPLRELISRGIVSPGTGLLNGASSRSSFHERPEASTAAGHEPVTAGPGLRAPEAEVAGRWPERRRTSSRIVTQFAWVTGRTSH